MRLVNWRTLAIAAAGFGLAACGDDVTIPSTPITFTVTPVNGVTCTPGQSVAVGINVSGVSGTPSITYTAGSSLVTVTGSGSSATVVCGNTAGASAVNFTIASGGQTTQGSIPVTITGTGNQAVVQAITVNPTSATVVPGGSATITAQVTLASGAPATTSTAATFTSSDTTIVRVTNNANGTATVTAVNNNANVGRQAVITAQANASPASNPLRAFTTITIGQPSSLVQTITVSPATLAVATGSTTPIAATVQLAAGAPATTSTNVTCSSSNAAVATTAQASATAPCVITARGAGSAIVTIRAVADTNSRQTVAVTVTDPAPVRLTVQSLETTNAQNQNVTIDPTNVAGRVIATLNLDPGTFTPDSVVANIGGARTLCQRFTAQLAQALKASLVDGSADFAPIQCFLNTAQFDTTTGAVSVQNGDRDFTATVFYRPVGGGTGSQQSATISRTLTINNQSGFYVAARNTPTAAQLANGAPANGLAQGPQGVVWRGGDLSLTVVPVNFTALPAGTTTQQTTVQLVDFGTGALAAGQTQASLAGLTRVVAQRTVTTSATTGVATANFGGGSAAAPAALGTGNTSIAGYTSPNAGIQFGGTYVVVGGAGSAQAILNAAGSPVTNATLPGTNFAVTPLFLDNQTPDPRGQFISANFLVGGAAPGAVNGLLGSTFTFADSVRQTAATTVLADNNGSDRVSRSFFFTSASNVNLGSATLGSDIVGAGTNVTRASDVPAATAGTYVGAVRLSDVLGNATSQAIQTADAANAPTGAFFRFGVDLAPPTLTVSGGIANNTAVNINGNLPFSFALTDNIGFGQNPLLVTISGTDAAGNTFCGNGVGGNVFTTTNTGSACTAFGITQAQAQAGVSLPITSGIYTITYQARDVAGNLSPATTRTVAIDNVAPTVSNVSASNVPTPNQPLTITGSANDDLGLAQAFALAQYPNNINLLYGGQTLGTIFTAPLTKNASLSATIPSLIRSIEPSNGGAGNAPAGGATLLQNLGLAAQDVGGNYGFSTVLQSVTTSNLGAQPASFAGTISGFSLLSTNAGGATNISASGANSQPTTLPVQYQLTLANANATTPFVRVDLFYLDPSPVGGVYRFVGSFPASTLFLGNGVTQLRSDMVFTAPQSLLAQSSANAPRTTTLLALAIDANGNALAQGLNFTVQP